MLLCPILQSAIMASHALYMLLVQLRMPWFSLSYTSSLFIAQTRSYIFQVREVFHNGVLWSDIIPHDLPAPQASYYYYHNCCINNICLLSLAVSFRINYLFSFIPIYRVQWPENSRFSIMIEKYT